MHRDEVYRDPETGQFVATDDDQPVELTYADHEFVNARLFANHGRDSTNDKQRVEYQVETDVLDLENDELGMLSWMSAALAVNFRFVEDEGQEAGSGIAEAQIGANLSGQEYIFVDSGRGVEVTEITDNVNGEATGDDEAGTWASLVAKAKPSFEAEGSSNAGGGGSPGHDRLTRHFYDETGAGPYIDSTDDITASIELSKLRSGEELVATVHLQMSFVVFEYEHRRAEFAPYDPGPSGRM